MSVIVTLVVAGDPKALEQYFSDNPQKVQGIEEAAKRHGCIAHRFYASDDGGSVMVLDEWSDRQSMESFFQEQESEIRPSFEAARVTGQSSRRSGTSLRHTPPTAGARDLGSTTHAWLRAPANRSNGLLDPSSAGGRNDVSR